MSGLCSNPALTPYARLLRELVGDVHGDGYRGDYGFEATRQTLIEAKHDGIHPFCVTIDTEARDYLPHLYGAFSWALVEDVKMLPLKVSDISTDG